MRHQDMLSAEQLRALLVRARAEGADAQVCRRLEWILHFVEHRQSITDTCRHFGISRSTFHRWIERFDPNDLSSLEERSPEVAVARQADVPHEVVERIRAYRMQAPQVGKERIAELLAAEHGIALSVSTVGRIIERECMYFGDTPLHWRKRMAQNQQRPVFASHVAPSEQPMIDCALQPAKVVETACETDCPLCRLKSFNWTSFRSAAFITSILFNLALASLIVFTAMLEGQPTNAKAVTPTTLIPAEQQHQTSFLNSLLGIEIANAATGIYRPINYQGKLTNSGGVAIANGTYDLRFKIFSAASGGTPIWSETWSTATQKVTATGGLFSIALGTHVAMTGSVNFNSDSLFLQVEFDPGADGTFEEVFSPRRRFASVPYAHNANSVDGLDSTQFIRSDISYTSSGTITVSPRDAAKTGIDILSTAGTANVAALKISTQGANHIVFGTGAANYDTNLYRASANLLKTDDSFTAVGTISGATLVVSGNASISGSLVVRKSISGTTLEILGTASGQDLFATRSISGTHIYAASTFGGAGLADCDTAGTSKLLWDTATKRFSCGTDQTGGSAGTTSFSGAVLRLGDARYVKKQGDTMTGALVIDLTSGFLGLRIIETASGDTIHAEKMLSSSGQLVLAGSGLLKAGTLNTKPLTVRGAASQAANLTEWQSNLGAGLLAVTGAGDLQQLVNGTWNIRDFSGTPFFSRTNAGTSTFGGSVGSSFIFGTILGGPASVLSINPAINYSSAVGYTALAINVTENSVPTGMRYLANFKLGTTSKFAITATGAVGIGTEQPGSRLSVSGSAIIGNNLGTAAADSNITLEVLGTASGTNLYATKSVSGQNLFATRSISGTHLYAATTFAGAGLADCDTSGTSKLLWDSATKRFSCGTDQTGGSAGTASFSGAVLRLGDARYVKKSGDTMTGALVINVTGGSNSTLGLNVLNTISGAIVRASKQLTSSGTLITESGATFDGGTLFVDAVNNRVGIGSTNLLNYGLHVATTSRFDSTMAVAGLMEFVTGGAQMQFDAASGIRYLGDLTFSDPNAVATLILSTGKVGVGTTANNATLEVLGTASGTDIYATRNVSGSNLFAARSVSGTYLYAATTFAGAGLADCDTSGTSKLLWDSATKQFSCGTDNTGGSAGTASFSGAVLRLGDARYVKKSGDTMTGALTIDLTSGFLGLRIIETASGNIIHAEKDLTSSGTLKVVNTARFSSGASFDTNTLYIDANANRVGIGTATPKASLDVVGTISGKTLVVSGNGSFSGALVVKKSISGATLEVLGTASGMDLFATRSVTGTHLYAATTFAGAGLADCDTSGTSKLLWDSATKRFSCGTDNTGGSAGTASFSGAVLRLGDARYVRKAGDTMTGALTIDLTSGYLGLKIIETASGNIIHAEKDLTSSGTLKVVNTARFSSGASFDTNTLYIDANANRVGVGTALPKATLDIVGTLSGRNLVISNHAAFSGAVVLGSASTDVVTFKSVISGSLIPAITNTYSLGSDTLRWKNFFLSGAINIGVSGDSAQIQYDTVGDRIKFDADSDGNVDFRMADIGSFDILEASSNAPTASNYARIFARPSTSGGNDSDTTYLVNAEDASGVATNSAQGKTNTNSHGGSCISNSAAQAKFGTNSISLNCAGYQYYRFSSTNDDYYTTGDFTVDTWVYEGANTSVNRFLIGMTAVNDHQWSLQLTSGNKLQGNWKTSTGMTISITDTVDFPTGQWVHIAFERSGNTFRVYKNGTAIGSIGSSAALKTLSSRYLMLGNRYPYNFAGDQNFTGYMDEIRISKVARYSGNFTAPVAAYAGDTGGLFVRLSNGRLINLTGSGSSSGGGGGDSVWTVNNDNSIYYNIGQVGVGTTTPLGQMEVQQDDLFGSGALLVDQNVATGTGIYVDSSATGAPGIAISMPGNATSANPHLLFGYDNIFDTNLYRPLVNTLRTDGSLQVGGALTVTGVTTLNGNTIIGSDSSDTVTFNALVNSNITPSADVTYDLGTSSLRWRDLYLGGSSMHIGTDGNEGTIGYDTSANYLTFNPDAAGNPEVVMLDNGSVGIGTLAPKATLDVFGTISGATLTISGNGSFSGSLVVAKGISGATLEVLGTASGQNLFATRSITGTNIYAATTFGGAGLASCSNSTTSKLLYNSATKQFSCGTDNTGGSAGTASFSGAVLRLGDARYVKKSGDTMTGALTINLTSGSLGLKIIQTASGNIIHAEKTLTSSGIILAVGSITTRNTLSGKTLVVSGNASVTGSLVVNRSISGATLEILGTASGQNLFATRSISGTHLYAATTFGGAGLASCSNGTTSKLLYNSATKQFSCGTDQTGGTGVAGTASFSGSVLILGDARYVKKQGDTMTGALTIDLTSGYLGLKIIETASGNIIHAEKTLTSSGIILAVGSITTRNTLSGKTLVVSGNASVTGSLVVNRSISGATLEILGTASGQNLFATRSISGTHLYAATTFGGAGLASCSNATTSKLLYNSATKQFSCGTDQNSIEVGTSSFSGATLRLGDARYVKKQGDTMTGALTIDLTSGFLGLRIIETASGNIIHAEKTLTSSGTIVAVGSITTRNTLSGKTLVVSGNASITGSLVVNRSISGATLEILGTASGQNLFATRSISGTHLYAATTFGGAGLASCSNATTSKLLYNSATKQFSCGTDQAGGTGVAGTSSFSGAVLRLADARYVRKAGDTMTGALVIDMTSGNGNTLGLRIINTGSGRHLHAEQTLTSSGTLAVEGNATIQSHLYVPDGGAGNPTIAFINDTDTGFYRDPSSIILALSNGSPVWHAGAGEFFIYSKMIFSAGNSIGQQGTNYNPDNIYLDNYLSGSTLFASTMISTSGSLVVKKNISGATLEILGTASGQNLFATRSISGSHLYSATTFGGAGLVDCDTAGTSKLLWDAATKRFSCGTDQSGSSGISLSIADERYVKKQGDTMTGALTIDLTSGFLGLKVIETASGAFMHAEKGLSSSGTLVWEGMGTGYSLGLTSTLNAGGGGKQVYNSFTDSGTASHTSDITSDNDLFIEGALEVDGWAYFDNGITVSSAASFNNGITVSSAANFNSVIAVGGISTQSYTAFSNSATASHGLGSASDVFVAGSMEVDGTVYFDGELVGTTVSGMGLTSCTGSSNKLTYNSGTKQFACETDQTGGGSFAYFTIYDGGSSSQIDSMDTITFNDGTDINLSVSGDSVTANFTNASGYITGSTADSSYVNVTGGDSMNGTLVINSGTLQLSSGSFNSCTALETDSSGNITCGSDDTGSNFWTDGGSYLYPSGSESINIGTSGYSYNIFGSSTTGHGLSSTSDVMIAGSLEVDNTVYFDGELIGTTITGFGLSDCDGTYSKLIYDSTSKQFSCSTDQAGGGGSPPEVGTNSYSGATLRLGDARYVKKQGDTMTGALTIDLTSGFLGLRIIETASGNIIHAEKDLTSSGTLKVVNTARFSSGASFDTNTLYIDANANRVGIGTATPKASLDVVGTISGKTLVVSGNGSFTGSLVVRKGISGATLEVLGTASGMDLFATRSVTGTHLYAATTFAGAGLADCDTSGTSKLLWDSATKRFSCGTDNTGGSAGTASFSGAVLRLGDARYVKKQGDTMTGALTIDLTSGYLGLKIIETASGNIIHAEKTLTSSGTILAVGSIATRNTLSGKTLVVSGNASVTGSLVVNKNISGAALEILGTASGLNLFATRSISGTHLYAATTFGGAGLTSCSNATTSKLLYNSATKQFSCGTDQTGGGGSAPEVGTSSFSGATLRLGDARYVKKQGDTMTGALVIDMLSGNGNTLGLRIINTASGRHLHAEQRLTSSGAIIWEGAGSGRSLDLGGGNVTFSLSGQTVFNALNRNVDFSIRSQTNNNAFFVDASTSRVGIGTNTLESAFEVVGSISGTTLIATGTGSKPLFFASAPWNSVGIGTATPGQKLTVSGGSILNVAGGNVRTLSGVNLGAQFNDAVIVGRYAYIGQQGARFRIVDISNPLSPKIVSTLGMETNISSIAVSGNYAYLGMFTSTSRALIVVDISNPSVPVQIASLDVGGMSETRSLFIAGKHLFVGKASGFSTNEFFVVDINNPYAPKIISSMDLGSSVGINSVVVQGKYAYLGIEDDFSSANEFSVIDISSPNNLINKGGVSLSTAVKSISIAGRYAYVGLTSVTGNDFRIFDISNPASISTVGGLDLTTDVLSVDVAGRYAYLGLTSVSGNDFRVVDVSNVALPAIVGGADISTSARKVIAAGKFLYVGLPDVTGADFTIYDINGIDAPSASIGTLGVDVLYVGRNASVANTLTVLNSINVGVGGIKSDGMLSITVGSGSTVSGMTGAIIVNRGMSGTVLALDSWRGNGTGSQKIVPHLLFGYRGTFDTMLYRAGTGVLANSGTMLLRGGTGRTLLKMETGMTSSADANLMEVFSNVTTGFGDPNHNLILRMDAAGSMYTDGSFSGGGADYAERFLASTPNLKPGQAVCLDPLKSNTVKLCDRSGDSNVMGIVSTKPAFVGDKYRGVTGDTKSDATSTIVGLIGQLPAKAIVEDGQVITVGDALATAAKPGFVRKAKAGESTVGVALSPLASGEGSIDVLITRRNQSDLVEKIENEVTQSIAEMHIEDDVLQMVQTAMNGANINATVASAVQAQVQSLNLAAEINAILNQRLADGTLNIGSNGSLPADILAALQTNSGSLSLQSAIASRLGLSRSGTSALTVGSDLLVSGALTVQHDVLIGGTLHAAAMSGPIRFDGPILPGTDFALGSMRFTGSTVQIGTITDAAALEVVGNVTIAGLTTFLGDVEVQGELIVSNNQAGFAIIPSHSKAVTVLFGTGFISTPIINATPNSRVGSEWWVDSQSQTGFVIRSEKPVAQDIRFSWTALGVRDAYTASGQAGAVPAIPFHVDAEGRPYSVADNVWNACIRDPNSLDACNGYHQGSMWFAHPDIMQANQEVLSFTYDAASGPSSLVIPASYETVVVEQVTSSSSSAQTSSTSSSASSESASSVASSESSSAMNSSESSSAVASSESSSSVASSESSSAVSSSASSEASVSSSADSSASSEQP